MELYSRTLNYEMSCKTHRTTASRRPTEEPAQSERKSSVNGSSMNDGVDFGSDKLEGYVNQNCAEFLSDGDSENTANIYSIISDNLHGEDKGGGEREHTHMGNYKEFIEETDTGNTSKMVTDMESGLKQPYYTNRAILRQLMKGYIGAIKEMRRHIAGTRGRCKWTRTSQASKDVTRIWDRWTERIAWEEVSKLVSEECLRTKDRWLQLGRIPTIEECTVAIQTARVLANQVRASIWEEAVQEDNDWDVPRNESERFWRYLSEDYQLAWNGQLLGEAFDGKTTIQLIDGYRRGLRDRHQARKTRTHRDWTETREGLAAKAALSDRMARYWQGPTKGTTHKERRIHRTHKRSLTNQAFKATLTHSTIVRRREAGDSIERVCVRLRASTRAGGYSSEEEEYSLFAQYVARVEQLPREQKPGHTLYQQLQRLDFDKMSRKRQMMELEKIGLALDSTAEAYKLYIRSDDIMYPSTHTKYEVHYIRPKNLKTA